jgi:hypothetical protein
MCKRGLTIIFVCGALLFLLVGCREKGQSGQATGPKGGDTKWDEQKNKLSTDSEYPILWASRDYSDIHPSAQKAWWLTETAYYMVKGKYIESTKLLHSDDPAEREKGAAMRKASGEEMDTSIFAVNDEVERLFLDAIAQEPDNPLNHATYALYLKPRKRYAAGTYVNTREEALQQVEKAIELWPDDAGFYMLKAYIISGSDRAHDWFRMISRPPEDAPQMLDELREAYTKAAQYYPDNAYINYSRAVDIFVYTAPDQRATVRDEILREIRDGNSKPLSIFYHGPPVQPFAVEPKEPKLFGTEKEPVYIDQWRNFGRYDYDSIDGIIELCMTGLKYPEDRETIQELMYFLYRLGTTRPFDRSFFGLQPKILITLSRAEDNAEERIKLQAVMNFINTQYREAATELVKKGYEIKSTEFDAIGISNLESSESGQDNLKKILQPRQAASLKKAEEELGMQFVLPSNPEAW